MRHSKTSSASRRGIALILVIGMGLVVLALGMAMLTTSSGVLQSTVDVKQRIRSRYAAEAMIAMSIARAVEKANQFFGAALQVDQSPMGSLGTGNGERGSATVTNQVDPSQKLSQELITSGRLMGMMGLKIPLLIEAMGVAPGGAKTKIDADVRLYQVPIFQFGVFYEGPLEITPGPDMFVYGPVHTNSDAFFRGAGTVTFQGPVTVSGTLWHWYRSSGVIRYYLTPDTSAFLQPTLTTSMTAINSATQPAAIGGTRNIDDGCEKLSLPIGGSNPRNLLMPRDSMDPDALRFQKFDWKISCNASGVCNPNRFVAGRDAQPSWIKGPRYFFDRREDRWVKVWDFDIATLAASTNRDSIFYLADTITSGVDRGQSPSYFLNAFRLVNGSTLPRNMSIASPNPIYILGNFNLPNASGPCKPADQATVDPSEKYCNAQIASDALTLLSPNWPNRSRYAAGMNGSLEQPWDSTADHRWTTPSGGSWTTEPTTGVSGAYSGTITVNAAILTGNKASNPNVLPPHNYSESTFDDGYEGGWHNTIRFLEDLSGATVNFKGSFVCMWEAASRGLDTTTATISIKGGQYSPPTRVWGFDPRFRNLNNMPPGTPFLATAIFTNWLERR